MRIKEITALQILDSRGNPTVEAEVTLTSGEKGRAAVPSGASTGTHEVLELRDNEPEHFGGQGVLTAVKNIETKIAPAAVAAGDVEQRSLDSLLLELDGTENKANLGANAILAVSLAYAHAAAAAMQKPLYQYVNDISSNVQLRLPRPMFNIMNGGAHANWATDVQEYMVIPLGKQSFAEQLEMGVEIFHSLEAILKDKGLSTNVGNEGGFAPGLESNEEAFEIILQAVEKAGYRPGEDIGIGLDIAASEFFEAGLPGSQDDQYYLKTENRRLSSKEWVEVVKDWVKKYPIISLEDPLAEDVWSDWHDFLRQEGGKVEQVVGDDLLVTNVARIEKAIELQACNALLVKPNQIGTLTETLDAMRLATDAGWQTIMSHRSGETEDVTIAHLAVGTACGQIKTGAPSRGERTAKYNELLRIEREILKP